MKVCIVLLILSLLTIKAEGQCCTTTSICLKVIAEIESGGDSLAINKTDGGSRGLYQIHPIGLKDYNFYHKEKYTLKDLFKKSVNEKIARWILEVRIPQLLTDYGYEVNVRNILISYNAGITYVIYNKKLPTITKDYIVKYETKCKQN